MYGADVIKKVTSFEVNIARLVKSADVHSNKIKQMSISADDGKASASAGGRS